MQRRRKPYTHGPLYRLVSPASKPSKLTGPPEALLVEIEWPFFDGAKAKSELSTALHVDPPA
jgi:hypothetical protein